MLDDQAPVTHQAIVPPGHIRPRESAPKGLAIEPAPRDLLRISESKHICLTLDGLRGIAAIAVVSFHTDSAFGGFILPHAYLAVDMFFVMSGIVLAHAYERRFAQGMTAGEFMRIRFIRLYPLYLLGTFIAIAGIVVALMAGVPLAGGAPTKLALAAVPAIAMLPSYAATIPAAYPLNSPSWSLLLELIANFLYALLFPLLSNRVLLAVMGVAAVGLLLTSSTGLDGGPNWESLYAGFPRVFWSFPLGVLLYPIKERLLQARRAAAPSSGRHNRDLHGQIAFLARSGVGSFGCLRAAARDLHRRNRQRARSRREGLPLAGSNLLPHLRPPHRALSDLRTAFRDRLAIRSRISPRGPGSCSSS